MPRVSIATFAGVALLATFAIGACSLFVDTDGLSGGDDAAIAKDASSDAPVTTDARPPNDAGPSDGGDAAITPFCASHPGHSICYDFDESTLVPAADATDFDPGHFVIDNSQSVSKPHSLLVLFNPGSSNQQIEKNIPESNGGKMSWSLDIRFSSTDLTTGQTTSLAVDVPAVADLSDHYFYLQTYYGQLNISEAATPADGGDPNYVSWALQEPVPADTWTHVEWTIDGSTGNMTFSLNGAPLANQQAQYGFPGGGAQVTIGGFGGNLPASTSVNIDNILIDY